MYATTRYNFVRLKATHKMQLPEVNRYVIKFVSDVWQVSGFLHKYN